MKIEWSLLPWDALEEVVKAAMSGNTRPGRVADDWKERPDKFGYSFDKIIRHLMERRRGKLKDEESGINPLAHLIFDALIALYGDIHDHVPQKNN